MTTETIDALTHTEAVERMQQLHERIEEIAGKHRTSKADDQEFNEAQAEFSALTNHVSRLERTAAIAGAAGGGTGALRIDRGVDPYAGRDAAAERMHSGQRDRALRQLERSVKGGLAERSAKVVERLVETGPDHERSWAQRWVTDTGADLYKSAFAKLVAFGEARAGLEWSAGERDAFNRVARLKQEQRALSLSDSAGGFLTPFEIDFSVILTSAGSANPLVQISRVVSTVSDVWHGVASAGVVSSWDAEASEISDDSPAFSEPAIPCFKSATFVPFSIEVSADAPTLLSELGRLMADSQLQLLNEALTVGSGTGQPTGIVAALTGGSSVVATATNDTLVADDIYAVQSSLGPRWQANARWCFNLAILNALRRMESGNGSLLFPELRATQPTLLGKPVHELSNMDGVINSGQANAIGLYGDFSNFVVSQRIGSAVELIPHLFSPNNLRPTGQRGLYQYGRWGSDSVNDAAFRLLVA